MPIGAAIGGAAVLGTGAAIYGADQQSDAIDSAARAQAQASADAIAEQRRQYNTSRQDQMPWLTTGGSALGQLAQLYGLDTFSDGKKQEGTGKSDMSGFFTSPDYQFRLDEGTRQVDASAAARGMLDSGATRKAQVDYASNLASGEFQNYANRLAGIAGVGQSSAQSIGQFGANSANNISNITMNQGDNLASSYLARGQVNANLAGQVGGIGSGLLMNYGGGFGGGFGGFGGGGMTKGPPPAGGGYSGLMGGPSGASGPGWNQYGAWGG